MLTSTRRHARPSRVVVAAFALAGAALLATTPVAFSADAESDASSKPAATETAADVETDAAHSAEPMLASPHEDLNDAASANAPDVKDSAPASAQ